MKLIILLLTCLFPFLGIAQNDDFSYFYRGDREGTKITRAEFDSIRMLPRTSVQQEGNELRVYQHGETGILKEYVHESLLKTLELARGEELTEGASIFISYYPGEDSCNSSGSATPKEKADSRRKFEEMFKTEKTEIIHVYKEPTGLYLKGKNKPIKDPNRIIEKLFFKQHYPCGSYVIIDEYGRFTSIWGEYSTKSVLENYSWLTFYSLLERKPRRPSDFDETKTYLDRNKKRLTQEEYDSLSLLPRVSKNEKENKVTVYQSGEHLTLTQQNKESLINTLEKIAKRKIDQNVPIFISFYSGNELCVNQKIAKPTKNHYKEEFSKDRKVEVFYIYKDPEGLFLNNKHISYHQDVDGVIEQLFFRQNYSCSGYVLIHTNGEYTSRWEDEFGVNTVANDYNFLLYDIMPKKMTVPVARRARITKIIRSRNR